MLRLKFIKNKDPFTKTPQQFYHNSTTTQPEYSPLGGRQSATLGEIKRWHVGNTQAIIENYTRSPKKTHPLLDTTSL